MEDQLQVCDFIFGNQRRYQSLEVGLIGNPSGLEKFWDCRVRRGEIQNPLTGGPAQGPPLGSHVRLQPQWHAPPNFQFSMPPNQAIEGLAMGSEIERKIKQEAFFLEPTFDP